MKNLLIIILLCFPNTIFSQTQIVGKVEFCEELEELINISRMNNIPIVKSTKHKDGKIQINYIKCRINLKDSLGVVRYRSESDTCGKFKLDSVCKGFYNIQVYIAQFLRTQKQIQINNENKIEINFCVDDTRFRAVMDSIHYSKIGFSPDSAYSDIEKGEIFLLDYGLSPLNRIESDSLTLRFGFQYRMAAYCSANDYIKKAIHEYNEVVINYLDSVNYQGWYKDFLKEYGTYMIKKLEKNAP